LLVVLVLLGVAWSNPGLVFFVVFVGFRLEHLLFVFVLLVWIDMCDYSLCVKALFVVIYLEYTDYSQPGGVEVDACTVGCRRLRVYGLAGR
jgi:hypothetical protein